MNVKPEIFTIHSADDFDHRKYNYAFCECLRTDEGIRILRTGEAFTRITIQCPRCGMELGIYQMSREAERKMYNE